MRERALVHISGPSSAGRTTFVERLLDEEVAFASCVRAEHDARLRKDHASAPKPHAELRRYREAGASAVALYRFAEPSMDAFFTTGFMQDYSEAVFIEGTAPSTTSTSPCSSHRRRRRRPRCSGASSAPGIDQRTDK